MQSLINRVKPARAIKADPAPSRWAWRMQRLMLTPAFLFGLRFGVPFCLALLVGTVYLTDDARRGQITDGYASLRSSIQQRPEFMVKLMAIDGAGPELAANVRAALPIDFPTSSFDLDLAAMRSTIMQLPGVKHATLRVKPGGLLQVEVEPRVAVAVWRSQDGLALIDASGAYIGRLVHRTDRSDLPLVAGEEANVSVAEALDLLRVAAPLGDRLRGFVRMGARRWDVVLDREQRILLPETGAIQALERVIALEGAQEVLTRDVARVDMRLAQRPTVQMNKEATQEWWRIRQISGQ
ncbi:cell division protein FtsQ/DivIB [Sulfitobacter sp. CW3]|jgi:cell division protein FtsQ|uniref:cell division protein FtsQ/DivIB n=1 Tax=Sulfitobacter sp. CW3 TaxID=2861965 RepID=UPI0019E6F92D|nr:cell division protein FtsQ/DivIB [Sulfitobacter sp. CW3]MBW4960486.1 cell division protein FtsQ/DivIB [Sulfitobacter sp. CW3]NOR32225.1 cell division protein FtsQ [Sulfitobacter sp.]